MNDLNGLFRALSAADRERAPAFAATMRSAEARARAPRRPSLLPAVAAVAAGTMLALSVVDRLAPEGSADVALANARDLAAWSAPTSVFLDPLDRTISASTPTLTLSSITLPE
jgi:hypothetical protein